MFGPIVLALTLLGETDLTSVTTSVCIPVLGTLHLADLYRNPKMTIPTVRDWQKVREFLDGKWPLPQPEYRTEVIAGACEDWFRGAHGAPFVAIDTEYNPDNGFLLLIGLGYPGARYVSQFDHKNADWRERRAFGELLKELIITKPVIFQNAIADIPVIEQAYGITHRDYCRIEDTMLGHAVLWSDWPHTLEFLASIYGKHNKMKHLSTTDPNLYNVGDVVDTISAWEGISGEFKGDPLSYKIYRDQSINLIPIILKAQSKGLRVNRARVDSALQELSDTKKWAQSIAQLYAGYPINIGSDDQLKFYLYEEECLPPQFLPRSKKWTVDGDAIAALRALVGPAFDPDEEAKEGLSIQSACDRLEAGAHPILEARVVYAAAQQSLSHYVLPMCYLEGGLKRIKDEIHPHFLCHAQASGRWSTVDPPMAQIPKTLQDLVIPHEGERWIDFDWDQIELRLLGALSQDEIYQEAFQKGWDIHTLNCCDVFGWEYPSDKRKPHDAPSDAAWRNKVKWAGKDDPRRRFAKVFIFRLNYGGEAKTATDIPGTKQLGLKAGDLVIGSRKYLGKHPRIRQYWDSITREGIAKREIRTFRGRRRRLLTDSKSAMKRLIYNHPMQGGVSDIFNITLIRIANALPNAVFKYGVHDSQKWGVPEHEYDRSLEVVKEIVNTPWNINGTDVVLPATFKG